MGQLRVGDVLHGRLVAVGAFVGRRGVRQTGRGGHFRNILRETVAVLGRFGVRVAVAADGTGVGGVAARRAGRRGDGVFIIAIHGGAVRVAAVDAQEAVGAVVVLFHVAGVAVFFLGNGLRRHGGLVRAGGVGEIVMAFGALIILVVARRQAGGSLGLDLHPGMAGGGNRLGIGRAAALRPAGEDFDARVRAGGFGGDGTVVPRMRRRAAVLAAAVDAQVAVGAGFAVAVIFDRAGVAVFFLGDGLRRHGGLGGTGLGGVILLALCAVPVFVVARGQTGGGFGLDLRHAVAGGADRLRLLRGIGIAARGKAGGVGAHARRGTGGLRGDLAAHRGGQRQRAGITVAARNRSGRAGVAVPVESGGSVVPAVVEHTAVGGAALGTDGLRRAGGRAAGTVLRGVLRGTDTVGAAGSKALADPVVGPGGHVMVSAVIIVALRLDRFRFLGGIGLAARSEAGSVGTHARALAGGLRGDRSGHRGIHGSGMGGVTRTFHRGVGAGVTVPVEGRAAVIPDVTQRAAVGGVALGTGGLTRAGGRAAGAGLRGVFGPIEAVGAAARALAVVRAAADVMVRAAEIVTLRAAAGEGRCAVRAAGSTGFIINGGRSTGGGGFPVRNVGAGAGVTVGMLAHALNGKVVPLGHFLIVTAGVLRDTNSRYSQNSGLADGRRGTFDIPVIPAMPFFAHFPTPCVLRKITACRFCGIHRVAVGVAERIGVPRTVRAGNGCRVAAVPKLAHPGAGGIRKKLKAPTAVTALANRHKLRMDLDPGLADVAV